MSTDSPKSLPSWPWPILLAVYLILAVVFSLIQPLGRPPDEAAHVAYVKFLADNHHLPIWEPMGGGEAGYEAQHPPLYYSIMAVAYRLASPLAENWRWQVMRWFTILLVGLPMFFLCRRFFARLWGEDTWYPFFATATVMLMPMTLLYTAYINPDAMVMLWATVTLWLAWEIRTEMPDRNVGRTMRKRAALLGLAAGLAVLSKLSGLPAVAIALLAHIRPRRDGQRGYEVAWADLAITFGVAAVTCGWWFGRNAFLYGTPFIHTTGMMGTGAEAAARFGFWHFAWLTWRETYLSSWAQRGWFPVGFWTGLLYGIIILMTLAATVGLVKGKRDKGNEAERIALNYSGLLLALVFLGQQWAYWTVDVEFNAGGRYILVAMMGLALLLVCGLRKLLDGAALPVLWAWTVSLIVMNQVSIWCIWAVLNPRYAPGWQIFHFPR